MLFVAKTVGRVSCVTALAVLLAFGFVPAEADESRVWPAFDRPGVSLVSGVQRCGPALSDGLSEASQCLTGWAVNQLLLDAAVWRIPGGLKWSTQRSWRRPHMVSSSRAFVEGGS